jgi:hypothetical protein
VEKKVMIGPIYDSGKDDGGGGGDKNPPPPPKDTDGLQKRSL